MIRIMNALKSDMIRNINIIVYGRNRNIIVGCKRNYNFIVGYERNKNFMVANERN